MKNKVGIINLGCVRNLVDSEAILGRLKNQGHGIVDIKDADVAILNTCGFIEDAKKESIDTILDLIDLKKRGRIKKIIVTGCLAQRYGKELALEFKDVDAIVGVSRFPETGSSPRVYLTPPHFAYLKICESCYNQCSFCAIPGIKGRFSSRAIESLLAEVKDLDRRGIKELNIIGQDITAYGVDLYHQRSLSGLLRSIVGVAKNIEWIRLFYTFPAHVTDELIDVISGEEKICNYIDMPLQHISDNLLGAMNRRITSRQTKELVEKIKTRIPGVSLRTTFIVGLPGETEENFKELVEFVKEGGFEKVGVFAYSKERGTPAYDMPGQVSARIKKKRRDILMREQQKISRVVHQRYVGETLKVLIDEEPKEGEKVAPVPGRDGACLGRTEYDAPQVDGVVYVHSSRTLRPGDFVNVTITDSLEYDLIGVVS